MRRIGCRIIEFFSNDVDSKLGQKEPNIAANWIAYWDVRLFKTPLAGFNLTSRTATFFSCVLLGFRVEGLGYKV